MKETMGQVIRRLRREKNLSQEQLAEQLGVTFQAVSKWENDAGMPDISQVVPIAHVFGVSTDVLFGTRDTNDRDEVMKIFNYAQSFIDSPLTSDGLYKKYCALKDGLKLYPNNMILLTGILEAGVSLAYPENDVYDEEHAGAIYRECIRYANLVISYSPSVSDVLRARMIMVILHSANGNFSAAFSHAEQFPVRADFNVSVMYAYYAHWKRDYENEAKGCQFGVLHYLEGMANITTRLALCYERMGKYKDAERTLEVLLGLFNVIFSDDETPPPVHCREQGDIYMLLAGIYTKDGDFDRAIYYLEKMVDYDMNVYENIDDETSTNSPLLRSIPNGLYVKRVDRYRQLKSKLTDARFDALKSDARYRDLINAVEATAPHGEIS